jgi:hypothetical protein
MKLIEKKEIGGVNYQFFDGIDFDMIDKHPKNGSSGFLYFFINSWVEEVKRFERESTINSVLDGKKIKKINTKQMENDYICIYQTSGIGLDVLYKHVMRNINMKLI